MNTIEQELQKMLNPKIETKEEIIDSLLNETLQINKKNLKFTNYLIELIESNKIELPVLPHVATKILQLSFNSKAEFTDYSNVVKSDSVIALKVIQLANSPLYRGLREITDLNLAISRIGIEGLKEIVIMLSMKMKVFNNKFYKAEVEKTWKFSLITALISSSLAQHLKISPSIYYTIGLIHDIGSIVLYSAVNNYRLKNEEINSSFISRLSLSFHTKLSYLTLKKWEFKNEQLETVKNHHILPNISSSIDHKILYLAHSVSSIVDSIKDDYNEENLFPYEYMVNHSKFTIEAVELYNYVKKAVKSYEEIEKIIN